MKKSNNWNIVVVPFSKVFRNDIMFDAGSKYNNGNERRLSPYIKLYNELTKMGFKVATFDKFDKGEIKKDDIYLSFNHHERIFCEIGNKVKNRILIAQEPLWKQNFSKETFQKYSKILSWNDSIIDNVQIDRITSQPIVKMNVDKVAVENRKMITNISMNKKSRAKGELYSERRKAIELAEKIFKNDFEFYGVGWNQPTTILEKLKLRQYKYFKSYRGETADKFEILRNYKFSLCFENTRLMKGYISEKIFDCFQCGVIPLYWGAPNVKDFFPEETFIWREDFETTEDMLLFVEKMSHEEIKYRIECINNFFRSEKMNYFFEDTYVSKIIKAIQSCNKDE